MTNLLFLSSPQGKSAHASADWHLDVSEDFDDRRTDEIATRMSRPPA